MINSDPRFQEVLNWVQWIPLRCPLKLLTGLDCPLCGLGRSLLSLFLGDWRAAWSFNPLGPILSSLALLSILFYLVRPLTFLDMIATINLKIRALDKGWKWLALGIYFLLFILRNQQ